MVPLPGHDIRLRLTIPHYLHWRGGRSSQSRKSAFIFYSKQMPEIQLRGKPVEYELCYLRRSRNIRITISSRGELRVSSPYGVPRSFINGALRERAEWILRKLREFESERRRGSKLWREGSLLPYLDGVLLLQVLPGNGVAKVRKVHGALQVVLPKKLGNDGVRTLALDWYREKALEHIPARVEHLAREMRVKPSRITIRQQRSRWGSCSAGGTLSLNMRLMMTPTAVLDYVLVHELAHLKELNHSRRFWRIVAEHCPDAARQRDWLREHGWLLDA